MNQFDLHFLEKGRDKLSAKRLLDSLSTALMVISNDLTIIYLNPAAENLFATSESRINDMPLNQIFSDDPQATSDFEKTLQTGHPYTKREAKISTPGNAPKTVDYSVTPVILKGKETELKPGQSERHLLVEIQQLDRLIRISRDESQFSTHLATRSLIKGVAHEIKNPLGGIRGAAQLLQKEISDSTTTDQNHDLQDYIDVIIGETDRLTDLVDRMLGPNQLPQIKSTNIHYVLERVKQVIDAESQGLVTIKRDYDTSIPEFDADTNQLIQAIMNITRNAMQALTEKKPGLEPNAQSAARESNNCITLRTRIEYHLTIGNTSHRLALKVSIIDNGPGIDRDIQEMMFYPLVSGRAKGTGLGLSIAQSIIQHHKGMIECESRPGQTTFNIFIPLEQ